MINEKTAVDIALAYREIKVAEDLLAEVEMELTKNPINDDVRDCFGRRCSGLTLGVPTSNDSRRLFNVEWVFAKPILEAHIHKIKANLAALNQQALVEGSKNDYQS